MTLPTGCGSKLSPLIICDSNRIVIDETEDDDDEDDDKSGGKVCSKETTSCCPPATTPGTTGATATAVAPDCNDFWLAAPLPA